MSTPLAIEALHVEKRVEVAGKPLQILSDISLHVDAADTVAIVGSSGSGKSTLIGLLAGLDIPSGGTIKIADQLITGLDEDQRAAVRANHVGFVFQSFQLLPNLTAIENVSIPLEIAGLPNANTIAKEALIRVGLEQRMVHYPKQLSGGEQQRVALARAFAPKPGLLFADEPTGNLDNDNGTLVADLLFELNAENQTTLILVTHDDTLASRCARQLKMQAGRFI